MKRIAIDFDETLFPTLEKVIEIYNKRHCTNLELSQITTYSLYDCLDRNMADELIELFCEKEVYDNLQPYKGAVEAIKFLVEQGYEVYIATATNVKNMEWKEQLLQKYFPFVPKDNLIRIHNKALLNVDMLIEDSMRNLTRTFANRVCFDQTWNRDPEKDYVYSISRIYHWDEITKIIDNIERKEKEWEK